VPQQKIKRALGTGGADEAVRHAGIGRGAELQVGRHEARAGFGDGQIASQHQRQARARRHTVHLRQPDLVHARDARDEIIERREEIRQRGAHRRGVAREHADVAARAEGLARAAQQHDLHGVARFEPLRGPQQVAGHGDINGVERVRTVQRQGGEGAFGLQQQRLELW